MKVEFDPAKDAANLAKHGISLARAADLDIQTSEYDSRFDYGEIRVRAFGRLEGVPYCLIYTIRSGSFRAISLRRARAKEYRRYGL